MSLPRILVVPDTQLRPGVATNHLDALARYAYDKRPEHISVLGDWYDLPSLSLWDSAAAKAKQKRVLLSTDPDIEGDIDFAARIWVDFIKTIHGRSKTYSPRIRVNKGNHEFRLTRYREEFPHLGGALSEDKIAFPGANVFPFLTPYKLLGITFCHFFCADSNGRVMNTKRGQASARAQIINTGGSAIAGHKQGLDTCILERSTGRQRGIIAGSFYQHDEDYLSAQGNQHWRGALILHEVAKGDFNLGELSLNWITKRYG